ncbi:hypothetical protein DPV78_003528 [Talaromyces pinophilus]|nr:hypothetical protein DPV78_003528 [Talaromyces pinophilus]
MVMRAYNAGVSGALRGIKTDLQAQNWEAVATKMGNTCLTDKDGGDLSRLRQEEKELFLRPVSPGLESDCSQQDTASSHEADFRTYASAPNIRIPIGEGMHMGVGFEPSGAPRFQIGFTCKMM